jgi:AraC-like DNA-binding protein
VSLAGSPKPLIENPPGPATGNGPAADDVLSNVLRNIRLSGSLQFCFMPSGAWQTDGKPRLASLAGNSSDTMPFHIMVEGTCWLKMEDKETTLNAGDVVAFPFATGHQLGAGSAGRIITPVVDLPPKPWRQLPFLRYEADGPRVRLLCGYLQCAAVNFRPFRNALPSLLHFKATSPHEGDWLRSTIQQIVNEVEKPRSGGLSMLERLTEITFIELLRHYMVAATDGSAGWLSALGDPHLGKCLSLIHDSSGLELSVNDLSAAAGLSRSALAERFETMLNTSPMRYLREWRLCQASVALATSNKAIASIADEAGYGTEAAFNRAFSRLYGAPPAAWRQKCNA